MTKPVTGQTTFGANTTGTTTQLDNNFLLAYNALNDFNTYGNYLVDNGAANAYSVSLAANLTGSLAAGLQVQFKATNANTGASTFAFNGTAAKNILNPNGTALTANQIPAGGVVTVIYDGTQYILLGAIPSYTFYTNSLSGDVACNNTAIFFDGPIVAQGTVGTWWAAGSVTVEDTAGASAFYGKLWDGTSVIDAGQITQGAATQSQIISLAGPITSPAGNIRISVRDVTSTSGFIRFNKTGTSKDSTVSVYRIG